MPDLKRNIRTVWKDKEPFWGKYKDLNNAVVPSLNMIQEYQLQKIQMFEKISLNNHKNKHERINQLFKSGQINSVLGKYRGKEEEALSRAISDIVQCLNWTYSAREKEQGNYDYQKMQEPLKYLIQNIKELNNIIQSNGGQEIPEFYLNQLEETLNACQINSLNSSVLDTWFSKLNKFKGDLVEDIGVAWLSGLKIPNITTLNTGSLYYKGEKFGRQGQLIQDLMTLSVSKADLGKISLEYILPSGEKVVNTLEQFMIDMEKASGQNKMIRLDDNGYEALLNLSVLNVQAKSGFNQLLWNQGTLSTSVSINEFSYDDGLMLSAKRTFELLHQLDQDNIPEKDIWVKDSSRDYNMLADYGLATVLFKILHIGEHGNDYVLTPSGFTPFSTRMAQLMEKRKSRITVKGGVVINDSTLTNVYAVGMTNY